MHCWYCPSMSWGGYAIYEVNGKKLAVSMAHDDKDAGEAWMLKHGYCDFEYLGEGKFIWGDDPFR